MRTLFKAKILAAAALLSGCGISEGPSLIRGTKDIKIKVAVDWTMSSSAADAIGFTPQAYILHSYATDLSDAQVAIGLGNSEPTMNLPVTLTTPSLAFDATLRVPVSLNPRASGGYALRFELVPVNPNSSSAMAVLKNIKNFGRRILGDAPPAPESIVTSEETHLISFNANIQAGTSSSSNVVPLSLATTFAYSLLASNVTDLSSTESVQAYADLVDQFKARQTLVEGSVDSGNHHDFTAYVAAIVSGIKYEILTDRAFQTQVANSILNVIIAKTPSNQINSTTEKFAEKFTDTLLGAAQDVATILGNPTGTAALVFNTNNYSAGALPDPDSYSNVVFAPAQMTFTDTDNIAATLGGNIQITPPSLTKGVVAYRIYFGGETRGSSRDGGLVAQIPASASTMTYALSSGTSQAGSRFWAYPVANGSELNIPSNVAIYNLGGSTNPPSAPTGLTATAGNRQINVSWTAVSGADSYNLYYGTQSPLSGSSAKVIGASSPYFHMGLVNGTKYYYAVTVIKNGLESPLSSEVNATPNGTTTVVAPAAPASLAATGGSSSVNLTWTLVSGATSYNLYWSQTSPVTFSSTRITGITSSPYTHNGDLSDGTYYYKITAVKNGVESALSNQATATVGSLAELTATAASSTQIDLSWSTLSGSLTLLVKTGNVAPTNCTDGTPVSISSGNTYSVQALTASTAYSFVICKTVSGTAVMVTESATATTQAESGGGSMMEGDEPTSPSVSGSDSFGFAVAVSGSRALIGNPWLTRWNNHELGEVYAFEQTGGVWRQTGTVRDTAPENDNESDGFGAAIAMYDDSTAVIGAPWRQNQAGSGVRAGAAFYFEYDTNRGEWTKKNLLKATSVNGADNDGFKFGQSVAIADGIIAVGAPRYYVGTGSMSDSSWVTSSAPGSVFLYVKSGSTWSETRIGASNGSDGARFGTSVALANNQLFVGAPNADAGDGNTGLLYIYNQGQSWGGEQQMYGSGGTVAYGNRVAAKGTLLAVSDTGYSDSAGKVYTYKYATGAWNSYTTLTSPTATAGDRFGWSLAIDSNNLVVGTPGASFSSGAAWNYYSNGFGFYLNGSNITASVQVPYVGFGGAVAVSGQKAVIGADLGMNPDPDNVMSWSNVPESNGQIRFTTVPPYSPPP